MTPGSDRKILEDLIHQAEAEEGFGLHDLRDFDNLELHEYYQSLTKPMVSYPAWP